MVNDRSYQPEDLQRMAKRLYVANWRMGKDWVLLPVMHDGDPIYEAAYSELAEASPGDLFVMHRDRLLHALFTMMPGTLMVEMPAESALIEQPLDYED